MTAWTGEAVETGVLVEVDEADEADAGPCLACSSVVLLCFPLTHWSSDHSPWQSGGGGVTFLLLTVLLPQALPGPPGDRPASPAPEPPRCQLKHQTLTRDSAGDISNLQHCHHSPSQ